MNKMLNTVHPPCPKRVLSICGGGLLGVIPLAFLTRFETLGREAYGPGYRLSQSFDLVGGSSTGAILATAVALGLETRDMVRFYLQDAHDVFDRPILHIPGVSPRFSSRRLRQHIGMQTADNCMRRSDLKTDLGILIKDVDGGRTVLATSCKPNEVLGAEAFTAPLPLLDLISASTAAPGMFSSVSLPIGPAGVEVTCVDGAFSANWDPSVALWSCVTNGPVDLICLGTGASLPKSKPGQSAKSPAIGLALRALAQVIRDAAQLSAVMLDNIAKHDPGLQISRFDMSLSRDVLRDLDAAGLDLRRVRDFTTTYGKAELYGVACQLAEASVRAPLPLREQSVAV